MTRYKRKQFFDSQYSLQHSKSSEHALHFVSVFLWGNIQLPNFAQTMNPQFIHCRETSNFTFEKLQLMQHYVFFHK